MALVKNKQKQKQKQKNIFTSSLLLLSGTITSLVVVVFLFFPEGMHTTYINTVAMQVCKYTCMHTT